MITIEELRRVFGSFSTDKEIVKMMHEVDENGDGKITFPEFKAIMAKFKASDSNKIAGLWSFCY
ncbi:MAG: EF-hand domain-containing protein [Candidatus Pacebacteria bacterium]|nr:EF-hand domain-containing protein [Candidatus Paceibacterota bacterium]